MKIDPHTLVVLSRCNTVGQHLYLPPEQLARPDYVAVNKVIEAMGGKWNRSAKAHVFAGAVAEAELDAVLETGEVATARERGFFPTRGRALDLLMGAADVRPGHTVLEPSAGEGDIVKACFLAGAKRVDAVEIDPRRVSGLRALSVPPGVGYHVDEADFLMARAPDLGGLYHRVVMNPPFSVPGDRRADLAHVLHATQFVAPRGRLVAIMSAGVLFREDKRTLDFLKALGRLSDRTLTPMPEGSFVKEGTSVNTALLTLRF